MAKENLDSRIDEALDLLESLPVGSKERESLVKEIETLMQLQTAEYRAEVEAADKKEQREIDRSELGLKEAEVEANKKRTWVELVKIGACTAVNIFITKMILRKEEDESIHTKATSMLPKGRFW